MCLAVPGLLESVTPIGDGTDARVGRVRFGGVTRDVRLDVLPEARPGDYVLVHVGLALSVIDEAEARRTLADLAEIERLGRDA
jgi:hydrogenase expression/formation protein HypC